MAAAVDLKAPTYREGYPRLIGHEVRRVMEASDLAINTCRFSTQKDHERGWLQVMERFETGFLARWWCGGPGITGKAGSGVIEYCNSVGRAGRPSPFQCPNCFQQVGNLVFKLGWWCARCQKLRNRTTLLPKLVREEERREKRWTMLAEQIGSGRPRGMRQSTYAILSDELQQLERTRPSPIRARANRDRLTIIVSEWMSEEAARTFYKFNPRVIFRD